MSLPYPSNVPPPSSRYNSIISLVENSVEMWKTLFNKSIDNVDNIDYNRGINIKRKDNMSPEELKKLEEEHKKAMEAINAFNKEVKGLTNTINEGLGKNKFTL